MHINCIHLTVQDVFGLQTEAFAGHSRSIAREFTSLIS